jgi:hypothetical protein
LNREKTEKTEWIFSPFFLFPPVELNLIRYLTFTFVDRFLRHC